MPKPVFVSAGHSDQDPGAISASGLREENLAQDLRNLIRAELTSLGSTLLTDGVDAENKPLKDAIKICKQNKGGINIELHFNAGPAGASGVEALCHKANQTLAQSLCLAIAGVTQTKVRGDRGYKPADSGQHHRLGFCDAGGIIIEVEFLSHAAALTTYINNARQVARAIARILHGASRSSDPQPLEKPVK